MCKLTAVVGQVGWWYMDPNLWGQSLLDEKCRTRKDGLWWPHFVISHDLGLSGWGNWQVGEGLYGREHL